MAERRWREKLSDHLFKHHSHFLEPKASMVMRDLYSFAWFPLPLSLFWFSMLNLFKLQKERHLTVADTLNNYKLRWLILKSLLRHNKLFLSLIDPVVCLFPTDIGTEFILGRLLVASLLTRPGCLFGVKVSKGSHMLTIVFSVYNRQFHPTWWKVQYMVRLQSTVASYM